MGLAFRDRWSGNCSGRRVGGLCRVGLGGLGRVKRGEEAWTGIRPLATS